VVTTTAVVGVVSLQVGVVSLLLSLVNGPIEALLLQVGTIAQPAPLGNPDTLLPTVAGWTCGGGWERR